MIHTPIPTLTLDNVFKFLFSVWVDFNILCQNKNTYLVFLETTQRGLTIV